MLKKVGYLLFGIVFGFALSRVGASDYNLIYYMFTGENFKLALVIVTAIVTAAVGMRVLALKRYRGFRGQKITVNKKPFNKYNAIGGIIFGIGWAISGACPGTVLAQVGEGKILGIFTMSGMILGTYIYALVVEKNPNIEGANKS